MHPVSSLGRMGVVQEIDRLVVSARTKYVPGGQGQNNFKVKCWATNRIISAAFLSDLYMHVLVHEQISSLVL